MRWFVIYSDATVGLFLVCLTASVLTASVLAVDPYACSFTSRSATAKSPELVLDCTEGTDLVATGFIRGGHVRQSPAAAKKLKQKQPTAASTQCQVPDSKSACWANPINGQLLSAIQRCLWKMAICRIPVNSQMLGHPCFGLPATYIFAENFKCVNKSRIVHLCSSSDKEQQLSLKASDGETFILSKGYPEIVAANLSCSLTITTEAERLRFESVYLHIHPKKRNKNTCDVDYLDIRPAAGPASSSVSGSTGEVRLCGREEFVHTSSATARIQFVSGPERKHYGGFVVRVTAVSAADSTRDRKAPEGVGVSSPTINKGVKNTAAAAAAIQDKSKKANVPRSKTSTKSKL